MRLSVYLLLLTLLTPSLRSDEGMIPFSEFSRLNLQDLGLKMSPGDLYNPGGSSLLDGIINLSGCTASFVSEKGLILTNYHCALRAIQSVSTPEKDYLRDGFSASRRDMELPAPAYTVKITESYQDVSREVLSALKTGMTPQQRTRAIDRRIKNLELEAERRNPGKRAEIAEMCQATTYMLFISPTLKDIRLVYAPPRDIGEYGGEEDNWVWPRHTGDFTFLRAYVAPDGSSRTYHPENIPFTPRRHLKVCARGVSEGDKVFVLGYPGRTYRHRPAAFLAYEEEIRMPQVVELYARLITIMEEESRRSREVAIALAPRIKGLWNTRKNYEGKLLGLRRLGLTRKRQEEEGALRSYLEEHPDLKKTYGNIFTEVDDLYRSLRQHARSSLVVQNLKRASQPLSVAITLLEAARERQKKDTERLSAYMDRNFERTQQMIARSFRDRDLPTDRRLLEEMLLRAAALPREEQGAELADLLAPFGPQADPSAAKTFLDNLYQAESRVLDAEWVNGRWAEKPAFWKSLQDPWMQLARTLSPLFEKERNVDETLKGQSDSLMSRWVTLRQLYLGKDFIPDANSTLRFTHGHIRGYQPRDAIVALPFTSPRGLLEKDRGQEPFRVPPRIREVAEQSHGNSPFLHSGIQDIPVAMLYDLDTTGGNSGSPVLNDQGELVGLNFDRCQEATINDYAWSADFSRSIGVDLRFILWFLKNVYEGQGQTLLNEMGVPST